MANFLLQRMTVLHTYDNSTSTRSQLPMTAMHCEPTHQLFGEQYRYTVKHKQLQ